MTTVIAICGTIGSGKSTIAENASAALPDCSLLFEDDFNRTTERSLEEISVWFEEGADVGSFDLSAAVAQLQRLCPDRLPSGHPTGPARSDRTRHRGPQKTVILETHFGRLHPSLRPWIDFQYWIDTPADIAVMRKVSQFCHELQNDHAGSPADSLRWIEQFCRGYLSTTRKLFELQRQRVGALANVTIDGQGSPLDVTTRFLNVLPQEYRQRIE